MSVYVDTLIPCASEHPVFRNSKACHMFADTQKELDEMASKIGLKLQYIQKSKRLFHYDLVESKRKLAIAHGAIEVDRKFVYDWMKHPSPTGKAGV